MLGNYIYSGDVQTNSQTPRKVENAVRRFLFLAVVFIGGGLIWILCISPCMVPIKAEVKSFPGLSKAEVLNIAGLNSGPAYISVNATEVEWLLSRYHLVESAKVVKRFPDRISIFLEPRKAVAVILAGINGRIMPVYFDRYGVAFKTGDGTGEAPLSSLPVISGIFPENQPLRLGMRLSSAYLPFFARIGAISDEDPKIWQAISEIGIVKKNNDVFDIILFPVHDSIRLRMSSDITKDNIYYALLMSDVCHRMDNAPSEIDVRSGLGVMVKEARFGN